MPQTKREIEAMLAGLDRRPNRRLGQNFLIDGNLMRKLVAAAEVGPDDVVLEVGSGTGSLTEMLLDQARHVVAVEVDADLYGLLRTRLSRRTNLTALCVDALANKSRLAPPMVEAVRAACVRAGGGVPRRFLLVANLPYQIASPLIVDLLLSDLGIARLCFTVQKEVAERITSPPGRKTYSPLSIVVQALCDVQHITDLGASVFWPQPKVDSSMLRLDVCGAKTARIADLSHFVKVVRTCFLHRRKKLSHGLAYLLGRKRLDPAGPATTVEQETVGANLAAFDLSRRPEQLDIEEWIALADTVKGLRVADGPGA